MNKELDESVLNKAWEEMDTPAREEARKEVLTYLDYKLEEAKTIVAELKKEGEQIEILINKADKENEIKELKHLIDKKWMTDLYLLQGKYARTCG